MVDKTTTSDSHIVVGRMLFHSVIIVAVVLFVDVLAVLSLPRLRDINVWHQVLFWEGLIMIMFGVFAIIAYVTFRHHRHIIGVRRPRIVYVQLKERVSELEISIAVAGVMLIILCIFVGQLFY